MALLLEGVQIVYDFASKESGAVLQSRLVDDHSCTLCLDTLHDALDGRLAEVVGVGLHRQAVDTYNTFFLIRLIETISVAITIISRLMQHLVRYKILSCTVAFDNSRHHVLRNVLVVCQELLGIFR